MSINLWFSGISVFFVSSCCRLSVSIIHCSTLPSLKVINPIASEILNLENGKPFELMLTLCCFSGVVLEFLTLFGGICWINAACELIDVIVLFPLNVCVCSPALLDLAAANDLELI